MQTLHQEKQWDWVDEGFKSILGLLKRLSIYAANRQSPYPIA